MLVPPINQHDAVKKIQNLRFGMKFEFNNNIQKPQIFLSEAFQPSDATAGSQ
jgi:hypothetical protein